MVKEATLPQKKYKIAFKKETPTYKKAISLEEFEKRCSEYQPQITTTGRSTNNAYDFTPAVKRCI